MEEMSSDYITLSGGPDFVAKMTQPFNALSFGIKFGIIPWESSPAADIGKISPRPILIAHGSSDTQTSVKHAYELYEASDKKAELWIEEGADHCIFKGDGTGPEDEKYRERILEFLDKSLKK
jgi:dipeptidyl aminopeptidase/acylaminoacyl peptidase